MTKMNDTQRFFNGETNHLFILGDCLHELKNIPKDSIDCVFTSPPYWQMRKYDISSNGNGTVHLGDEKKYDNYVKNLADIFDEIKRVLKQTGSLWLNLGDKYYNKNLVGIPWRVAIELQNRGWILRNDIIWDQMKGTQSAKDRLRDVYEHIFHFVKNKKYYYDHNAIRIKPKKKPRKTNGTYISATGVSGVKYRKQIAESEHLTEDERTNALQALEDTILAMKHGEIVDFRMTVRGYQRTFHSDNKKVSGRAKELEDKGYYILKMGAKGHLPSDIWRIVPEDKWRKDAHYAVFPEELLLAPIQATCPEKGIVLDPFSGTGSTVCTALKLNRRGIGIELSQNYIDLSNQRAGKSLNLFNAI